MESACLKDTKSGASAKATGREFHSELVQGKQLFLKLSEEVDICLSFIEWCALVLVEAEVKSWDIHEAMGDFVHHGHL